MELLGIIAILIFTSIFMGWISDKKMDNQGWKNTQRPNI